MNRYISRFLTSPGFSLALVAAITLFAAAPASAQCNEVVSGLRTALGITQSNQGNLIVSETGTVAPHSGRISIVDPNGPSGNRRTLLDGLPSGINDQSEPSGPAGVFMRGRTLYLAIGIGDGILAGPPMSGAAFGNPTPSSPIFSSILALHFSANVENNTTGFTLTLADQFTLASGQTVTLSNGSHKLTVELIADFPNFTPNPRPPYPLNVRGSNPFDLVAVGNRLYVTDGGQNTVRKVNIQSGAFSTLVTFPNLPNTLFPGLGGPTVEPVPTGIAYSHGKLLVTLFSGFPFPPGVSRVRQVDPSTGADADFITGRKTAIDVIALTSDDEGDNDGNQAGDHQDVADTDWLVLQHASPFGPFFPPPGLVLRFETPTSSPTTVAACLIRPTSMIFDEDSSKLYITELGPAGPSGGPSRVVSVAIAP
jgi:hypothetical protein